MDDLAPSGCVNPDCHDSGRRGGGPLRVHSRYGARKYDRISLCRTCGDRSSEREGTPLLRSHLLEEKTVSLPEHPAEGCGVRRTGRPVKVHRDTVMQSGRLAGGHAKGAPDELVALSPEHRRGPGR